MSRTLFEIIGCGCLVMGMVASVFADSPAPTVLGLGACLVLINIPASKP